jgi:hypothetical protein
LAAVGLVNIARWLWAQNRNATIVAAVIFSIMVIGMNLKYLYRFYVTSPRDLEIYQYFQTDLVEACKWLKPRFNDFDDIYITTDNFNMPYVVTAVALSYDPKKWFSEPIENYSMSPPEFKSPSEWDYYTKYGKMHFIYDYSDFSISQFQKKFTTGRTLFILRPNEFITSVVTDKLKELEKSGDEAAMVALVQKLNLDKPDTSLIGNLADKIIYKIYSPDGVETLWLCKF